MSLIKNDNIDYDQVALRFAAPVPPRTKSSVTVAALKQKFSSLPAIAQTLDENGDGFLSEGEIAKAMSKAGIIMQLADIRYIFFFKLLYCDTFCEHVVRAMLDSAEKDEDGRISVQSFARAAEVRL
jgi:Ca2+-binding EF-hand superfamily protein